MREWVKNHPEWRAMNAGRHHEHYHRYKALVFERLGNRCAICSWTDERALQIDHIYGRNDSRYDFLPKSQGGYGYGYLRKIAELENLTELFQLLCANHNWIKKHEMKEFAYYKR